MARDCAVEALPDSNKPHAIVVPYPAQGHINPLLKFAKILHHRGFHITFVNTEYNARRLLRSRGPSSLDDMPGFRFEAIPDGLPPVDANVMQDVPALSDSISRKCLEPFLELVMRVNLHGPPVSCFVFDAMMPFVADAAEKFGLPAVGFWPPSACAIWGVAQYPLLIEKGLVPLEDSSYLTNGFLDTVIEWIPGIDYFRLRDIPTFIRTTDPNDIMLHYLIRSAEVSSKKACAVVFNTFDALEADVLSALSSIYPNLSSVGPLNLVLDRNPDEALSAVGSNLWKEDDACLKWLDSFEHGAVVYVNFGSITVATTEQMAEFAWGLANSRKPFLWVIRPDLVVGESAVLPPGFTEETADRCMISGWCPQEEVLKHPSIGGFLTHSGWNSTLESMSAGVPMICWPFFADQQTNCWYGKNVWGIGMEIDHEVKREEVEGLVRELMEGEKGKAMKRRAAGWRSAAREAVAPGGSSYKNLEKLISLLLPNK